VKKIKTSLPCAGNRGLFVVLTSIPILLSIFAISGCSGTTNAAISTSTTPEATATPCFTYWEQNHPGQEWVRLTEADMNGDGRPDLIIIYRETDSKCSMTVVLDLATNFQTAGPVDAPVEDQVISVFDMDGKPPNEFSVSGRKGVNIGSAVFRLESDKIVQLFSSGYGDCC
jgi:hypothetical protein